jgi:hypothetical protein
MTSKKRMKVDVISHPCERYSMPILQKQGIKGKNRMKPHVFIHVDVGVPTHILMGFGVSLYATL